MEHEFCCRQCNKIKPKIPAEKIGKGRGVYFRDDQGSRWHGRICPDCHRANMKACNTPKGFQGAWPQLTKRKCRVCGGALRADRYFNHERCVFFREVPYGESEYGGYCQYGSGY